MPARIAFAVMVLCLAMVRSAAAPSRLHSYLRGVPPLPYLKFSTWAVMTHNTINVDGSTTEDWSYGQHVEVDWNASVLCRYEVQKLYPDVPDYTQLIVENYSTEEANTMLEHTDGRSTNCTTYSLKGKKLMPGGAPLFAPTPTVMAQLAFLQYTAIGDVNCSVWQYQWEAAEGIQTLIQWYVSVDDGTPQLLINKTWQLSSGAGSILTCAYNGYHETPDMNSECFTPFLCGGTDSCVANPAADPATISSAIAWVCGVEDCTPIIDGGPNFYPNTLIAHGTWAFDEYYEAHKDTGPGACNFGGAAELVPCNTSCTLCNASPAANETQVQAALDWVCGAKGIQDCSPIQPGGDHFFPNTTTAHANWAFNVYYQAYKCVPSMKPCDFNGAAKIVDCPSLKRLEEWKRKLF